MDTPSATQPSEARASPSDAPQSQLQILRLSLGGEMHAVRIDAVREILEISKITPVPLDFMRGVMNLRGSVIPVVDLAARLGLPAATSSRRSCVVIVDVALADQPGYQTVGALVDAVYEVADAGASDVEAVPRMGTRIAPQFIRSMVRVRGQATPELDLANILDERTMCDLVRAHGELH